MDVLTRRLGFVDMVGRGVTHCSQSLCLAVCFYALGLDADPHFHSVRQIKVQNIYIDICRYISVDWYILKESYAGMCLYQNMCVRTYWCIRGIPSCICWYVCICRLVRG